MFNDINLLYLVYVNSVVMCIDKNGDELYIGDRVKSNRGYEFTIEVINDRGWIWGSEIPERIRFWHRRADNKNHHDPRHCEKIPNRTSWVGSTIKFNFI